MGNVALAKSKVVAGDRSFWQDLLHGDRYKRTQGRYVRYTTFAALVLVAAVAAFRLHGLWSSFPDFLLRLMPGEAFRYLVPTLVFALGSWIAYRVINYPKAADFLISVEAEMNKVSWPTRSELIRSSIVVIVVIGLLVLVLFFFDVLLRFVLGKWLNILKL